MVELAPQQILSCDELDLGCDGGDTESAYHYGEFFPKIATSRVV